MAFSKGEQAAVVGFNTERPIAPEWEGSPLRDLLLAAPSTKARFARELVRSHAAAAGVGFGSVAGKLGGRRYVGNAVCEIKFSMEAPARFQQVRLPEDNYDFLLGVGARPKSFAYWLIPAIGLGRLIDDGEVTVQHADTSLWFFPEAHGDDAFSPYRMNEKALVAALAKLK